MKKRKQNSKPNEVQAANAPLNEENMALDNDFAYPGELDEMDDFAMADMHAIKDLLLLDPNDIEFRQRHAEILDRAA
jgi:hypothetical protein